MKKRIKKQILKIIKQYFNKENNGNIVIKKKDIKSFDLLSKQTCLDGICYLVLKKQNAPPYLLNLLKERFENIKLSDQNLKQAFDSLANLPFLKILIKDGVYKFEQHYIPGTRYSCDIDIWAEEKDIIPIYKILKQNDFYTSGLDIEKPAWLCQLGGKTNKNVGLYFELNQEDKTIIQEQKILKQKYNPQKPITELREKLEKIATLYNKLEKKSIYLEKKFFKTLENIPEKKDLIVKNKEKIQNEILKQKQTVSSKNQSLKILEKEINNKINEVIVLLEQTIEKLKNLRLSWRQKQELNLCSKTILENLSQNFNKITKLYKIIEQEKEFHTFHENGTFIDIHFSLFSKNLPFQINIDNLKKEKKNKYTLKIKNEDSIIIDACHFCFNLSKYKNSYGFQGFLKYLTDLFYKTPSKNFDWQRVIETAKKTNSCPQTYFYLNLAKNYLNAPVPKNILQELKKNGSKIQNFLLKNIKGSKLLFNQPTLVTKIYSKMYLEKGWLKTLITYSHRIYNKLTHGKK